MRRVYRGFKAGIAAMPADRPLRKKLFYATQFARAPSVNADWALMSSALAVQHGLAQTPLDLLEKTARPYLTHTFRPAERLAILKSHYAFMQTVLPPALADRLWHDSIDLGTVTTRDCAYRIELRRAIDCREEGELSIYMIDAADDLPLSVVTFSIDNRGLLPRLLIGGMQGQPAHCDKQRIVKATRQCGGMRPKSVVLNILQILAEGWNIGEICAVSNDRHVSRAKAQGHQARVQADYDSFWIERDGVADPLVGFILPRENELLTVNAERSGRDAKKAKLLFQLQWLVSAVLFPVAAVA